MNTKSQKYKQLVKIREKLQTIVKSFTKTRNKKSLHQNIIVAVAKPLIENTLLKIDKIIDNKKDIDSLVESAVQRTNIIIERLHRLKEKYPKYSQIYEDLRITIVVIHHGLLEMLPKGYTIQLSLLAPEEYIDDNYQEPVLENVKKSLDYWCAVVSTYWKTVKGVVRKLFKTRWDVFKEKIKSDLALRGFEGTQLILSF